MAVHPGRRPVPPVANVISPGFVVSSAHPSHASVNTIRGSLSAGHLRFLRLYFNGMSFSRKRESRCGTDRVGLKPVITIPTIDFNPRPPFLLRRIGDRKHNGGTPLILRRVYDQTFGPPQIRLRRIISAEVAIHFGLRCATLRRDCGAQPRRVGGVRLRRTKPTRFVGVGCAPLVSVRSATWPLHGNPSNSSRTEHQADLALGSVACYGRAGMLSL